MDFARKQLEKYGWSEGKGLGKNENGISQALKPKLKRNVTGVGHDPAADFTDQWWTDLYNKAATNIQVEEKNGKTKKIKTVDPSEFEITNSVWRLRKKDKNKIGTEEKKYGNYFIKTAVLDNGGMRRKEVEVSETESEDEKKDALKMTDEELFAACEGRTVHKGARHGLKALGKLARIAQQEKLLLTQSKYDGYSHAKSKEIHPKDDLNKDIGKKKNKESSKLIKDRSELMILQDETVNVGKKKKKESSKLVEDNSESMILQDDTAQHGKKKRKKDKTESVNVSINEVEGKNKSKSDHCVENDLLVDSGVKKQESCGKKKKKKTK